MIFKLVLIGLLTCIASSLWEMNKSVVAISTALAKP